MSNHITIPSMSLKTVTKMLAHPTAGPLLPQAERMNYERASLSLLMNANRRELNALEKVKTKSSAVQAEALRVVFNRQRAELRALDKDITEITWQIADAYGMKLDVEEFDNRIKYARQMYIQCLKTDDVTETVDD